MLDVSALRKDFPILHQEVNGHPLAYLDSAASTQKPARVIQALDHYYRHDHSNVHRGLHELSNRATAAYEAARARAALYLNARSPEEIVFTRGTTESINLVANTWASRHLRRGDVILLTEMEHHSNLVPWLLAAERIGCEIRYVPVTANGASLDLSAAEKLLAPPARLFAFTHISNSLGAINPVRDLCALARKQGITTLVDAAQSAGHYPVDVQGMGCDFLACSGHKMAGPTGIGLLWGRQELLEALPPWQGGGEMISSVGYNAVTFKSGPHKFEAGTPNIADAIGLHAAMDYLDGIGRENIAAHDQALASYAYDRLASLGCLRLLGPASGRAGLVSFVMEGVHAHDVVEMANTFGLALRGGHHCNQPLMKKLGTPASARASFYLYTTPGEIDRLAEALSKIHAYFNAG
jgi:cysteine desulfurase/selenocysteine lyase